MYRMYIDEVGTDALAPLDTDSQKFLSLTGVIMKVQEARDLLHPRLHDLKSDVFNQDPDEPLCLHRKDIMSLKGKFGALRNDEVRLKFDNSILSLINDTPYTVITSFIDKVWMLRQRHWKKTHPYNYLMEIMVEKYSLFLRQRDAQGDLMPEARHGKSDKMLQEAYENVREDGTDYASSKMICTHIRSQSLKFRTKKENIAGLQLCDLIAHPSHYRCRESLNHEVTIGKFASSVHAILMESKYNRSNNGAIIGYGIKAFG